MAKSVQPYPSGLSHALGLIPSGLYILTVRHGEQVSGMLASWVQQAGFEPPMLTMAIKQDRFLVDWIETTRRFTLNQIPHGSKTLVRHFGRGFKPEDNAFEGISIREQAQGGPVLNGAMAYLDAEVVGHLAESDHRIFLARITGGELLEQDAKPFLHVRANGFHY